MVGAVAIIVRRPRSSGSAGATAGSTAELRCLAVLSGQEGRGVGSQLLRRVEGVARGLGCTHTRFEVLVPFCPPFEPNLRVFI